MSEEEIKKIAREEILDTIKSKLDSSMIFTYINNLEQENKQLKEDKKELIEFLKEYDKYRNSFKWNEQDYIDTIEKIKEILGDNQ